ncbi:MAG: glycosyltransferase family 2 protein, partial [Candidatus Omnitrophica bacterium]|nr:glycosyltransferase family 2 protein [Candidatus Omnitrophota bacterium]
MIKESITVFFPLYNDEATVEKLVNDTLSLLKSITNDYELILVNDGSIDNTGAICSRLANKNAKIRVIQHEKNKGYGAALKAGFTNATKELVFYTDGDGQYDVKELAGLLPYIHEVDVVTGYKIKRSDPVYRKVLGKIYHWTAKFLFSLRVKDIDCDFRLLRRSIFNNITLESDSGVICVEMMKKIQNAGYKIKEVSVHHYPRTSGRSQFFRVKNIFRVMTGL